MESSQPPGFLPKALFSAAGVGKRFGDNVVLKSAALWVRRNRITALLGRNGCGKTTLLKCALGEIPMDHGSVQFLGESYERPRLWRLGGKGLRYIDQEAQLPLTRDLGSLLRIAAESASTTPSEWIQALRLEPFLGSLVPQLSRGERKRAALAVALTGEPECLILDEPLESLAPLDQELLAGCLKSLVDRGLGVLLTGHDTRAVLETATDVTWCVAGTTHDLGSVEEAVGNPQFVREYLGPRYEAPQQPLEPLEP